MFLSLEVIKVFIEERAPARAVAAEWVRGREVRSSSSIQLVPPGSGGGDGRAKTRFGQRPKAVPTVIPDWPACRRGGKDHPPTGPSSVMHLKNRGRRALMVAADVVPASGYRSAAAPSG